MYEMEIEIEVPLTIKIRYTPVKAEPDTWNDYHGGTPGHPAHIEDWGVVAVKYDNSCIKKEDQWIPVNTTYLKPTLDNAINFAVDCAQSDDEWQEQCLEHANKMDERRT